jgi:hypothetical protein
MEKLELKDYEHSYYCSGNNYYSRDPEQSYNNWNEFIAVWDKPEDWTKDDIDYNLIFRWDIQQNEESKEFYLELFFMKQRKGIFAPILIRNLKEDDLDSIQLLLEKHWEYLNHLWEPFKKS